MVLDDIPLIIQTLYMHWLWLCLIFQWARKSPRFPRPQTLRPKGLASRPLAPQPHTVRPLSKATRPRFPRPQTLRPLGLIPRPIPQPLTHKFRPLSSMAPRPRFPWPQTLRPKGLAPRPLAPQPHTVRPLSRATRPRLPRPQTLRPLGLVPRPLANFLVLFFQFVSLIYNWFPRIISVH